MAENLETCVLQHRPQGGTSAIASVGPTVVKIESTYSSGVTCANGASALIPSHAAELHFLRSRVRELEREKAELSTDNQRLRNMLVHEIPALLSTMWQTLGQINSHSTSMVTGGGHSSYALYQHASSSGPDGEFSPQIQQQQQQQLQEELSVELSESWDEDEPGGADLGLGSHMGEEAPICSQTDMEELRRSCSESQCTATGIMPGQMTQVEVYPGSGVLCDLRSWQAANQAPSPTAMARTLLLGVFDMNTLMNSNLRGGRSRRPAFQPQRSALDPHKINAIFNAILARFPFAKKGVIGTGINSKLAEIRFRSRRANRDIQFL
ncbi:uncharacterized protein LOC103387133 [Cynoglossus semilaevis]|uniref:uncharacterized protein LOC103387133 n=1 Tax=Cynoglossus semilaevis TaxID=244447 RepID=UPI000495C96B|nr:uncharacterized protein LOC103387133 [Cynoglossus semilaevis]